MISQKEKEALFLELHCAIEEAATQMATSLRTKNIDLVYPPNTGLSLDEKKGIESLVITAEVESAIRKIVADAASGPLFRLFSLLDGVADPQEYDEEWLGLALEHPDGDQEQTMMLHDEFLESYWTWRTRRKDVGWTLDVYEN